jgi:cytochrome c oxidase assembly protein subunit 15
VNSLVRLRDAVWRPTPASLRLLALLGVITNSAIIVSGAIVRVTASGLGCPTWPKCTGDSLVPTSSPEHPALNMAIEFSNRLLTYVLLASGVAVYIAARRLRPSRPGMAGLALLQPLGVVAQAGWGGVTVLTDLHPAAVAVHYLLSIAIIAAAVALYVRTGEGDEPARPLVSPRVRTLARILMAVSVAVLGAGTIVTGTGPHAGDGDARRFGFGIEQVTRVHSLLAWATVALTLILLFLLLRERPAARIRRRSLLLLAALAAQGTLGYVQYFTGVPAVLVILHMLGSALLWLAVLGVVFSLRDRGPLVVPAGPAPATTATPAVPAAGVSPTAAATS